MGVQKETKRETGQRILRWLVLVSTTGVIACTDSRQSPRGELRPSDVVTKLLKPEDLETVESNRGWTVVDPKLPPNVQLTRVPENNRIQSDFYSVRIDGIDTGIGFGRVAAQVNTGERIELVAFTLSQDNGNPNLAVLSR